MFSRTQLVRIVRGVDHFQDPDLAQSAQWQRDQGLGWRFEGLGDWTTKAIFDKLQDLGIDTDPARFSDQARIAGRSSVLEEHWVRDIHWKDLWEDFPFLAAEELWMRLMPDLLCPETTSRQLDDALSARTNKEYELERMRATIHAVMRLMDYLESFPPEKRAEQFAEVCACSPCDYRSALLEMVINYGGKYPDEITRMALVMTDIEDDSSFRSDLPLALAIAGRREQAIQWIRANVRDYKGNAWVHVHAGDAYEELEEYSQALACFREALSRAEDPDDWDCFRDRVMNILEKLGEEEAWADIERASPRPGKPSSTLPIPNSQRSATLSEDVSITPYRAGPKVGANDPCPCGSGKKYKKCCRK